MPKAADRNLRRTGLRIGVLLLLLSAALIAGLLYPALAKGEELLAASWQHPFACCCWPLFLGRSGEGPLGKIAVTLECCWEP